MSELAQFLEQARSRVDGTLDRALPPADQPPRRLHAAMRYSLFAGGKRLRPALAYAASELGTGPTSGVDVVAAALELVHTYSLIHDDLPAMDDDDLRRGKPTCHVAFDEGTAILAGDGLLTAAFALLANPDLGDLAPELRAEATFRLATAAGFAGMVGGQAADLAGLTADDPNPGAALEWIHAHKTGALIGAAVALGGLAGGLDRERVGRLDALGRRIGIAFQIADDILDVEATSAMLGKTPGKDRQAGKLTYTAVHGVAAARAEMQRRVDEIVADLAGFGANSRHLLALARYVIERKS